jgi:hypothetical protein
MGQGDSVEQAKLEERLARLERGVEQSLELLERGRSEEAQALLSELMGAVALSPGLDGPATGEPVAVSPAAPAAGAASGITDDELETAFADAEPELDRMRDADDVAQEAMLQADMALEAEGDMAPDEVGENFATETMAHLLERQGDEEGASRIRAVLGGSEGEAGGRPARGEVVATLERWLDNLRGGARA